MGNVEMFPQKLQRNQNTYFMFESVLLKIMLFMR